jgi:1-phosphatidylinositol phosphodiesterase
MGTKRTGLQFDNKTPFRIVQGSITYNKANDIAELDDRGFFSGQSESAHGDFMVVSGGLDIAPGQWFDRWVEVYNGAGTSPVKISLTFSDGQIIYFEYAPSAVFEEIETARAVDVLIHPVSSTPLAVSCWTRHDAEIGKLYEHGLITFTIRDVSTTAHWMGANPKLDSLRLNEFTIPGTHDSGTWTVSGNPQCHTLPLRAQLDAGIRFVDIRVELLSGRGTHDLKIYHGTESTGLYFGADILATCDKFLEDNPSETILMMVSRNKYFLDVLVDAAWDSVVKLYGGVPVADDVFAQAVKQIITKYNASNRFLDGATMPTLHEAKSRIVLASRYPGGPGIALGVGWPDDQKGTLTTGGMTVDVQDVYGFGFPFGEIGLKDATRREKIDKKWTFVKDALDGAHNPANQGAQRWHINYTSASGPPKLLDPVDVAKGIGGPNGINDRLLKYLTTNPTGYYGTVPMDFPEYPDGGAVISKLIDSNK